MPNFGAGSLHKLQTCHPDLQFLFYEVVKHFDCKVLEGFRNEEKQNEAFRNGKSKLQWPHGKHNHTPSLGIDVAPYPVDWNNLARFYWFAGYVMGTAEQLYSEGKITHKIRYGGDWNSNKNISDENFKDLVHFELVVE